MGCDHIGTANKDAARDLVLGGGPWDAAERSQILDYCGSDVDALARLLARMAPGLDLPRALLRGRYMAASAAIEWTGVPIDVPALGRLRNGWGNTSRDSSRRLMLTTGASRTAPFGSRALKTS